MGFSAAALQSLVNEAALLAARQRALCVGPEHFAEGIERVVRSDERRRDDPQSTPLAFFSVTSAQSSRAR
jgi:ATP-dependent Zn protease